MYTNANANSAAYLASGISSNIRTTGNIYANATGTTTTVANLVTTDGIFWANGTAFVSGSTGGLSFPAGDYGNLTDSLIDAFGAKSSTTFDLNADGAITTTDMGTM